MAKLVFDPLDPPTAKTPLPGLGNTPSIKLLEAALRMSVEDRRRPWEPAQIHLLEQAKALIEDALVPATAKQIGEHVSAVMLHYPPRALTPKERQLVARDWISDFGNVPSDIAQAACQQWRRSPNTYAPTPGHLLDLAKPPLETRRWWLRFATETLDRQKGKVS